MTISKNLTLYSRDEKGTLIPEEVKLEVSEEDLENYPELKGQTIKIVPMTRGELKKLFSKSGKKDNDTPDTTKDEDSELVLKYCKEPLYTKEETVFIKPVMTRSIVNTIFRESGIIMNKEGKKSMKDNDEFAKNSPESDEKNKRVD